ncbi:putative phosphinothricin acetyltransferase YwnH [Oxobacter pfennigii]|uniref:Putative phosphinothricin acetyltransferase YwnH n=1 Tax=Oxobacter pfennigii TaxID=36849 RepID=A0A0P8YFK1_9CLOT|nr:arsinothricin resistance N-acetyltransferase ArsN1 family A [Oxobacter pfennigii]KPU45867.1 putative phosphinothricin acetyltransferase YwnH [Oxobacter pfennigii]
MGYVTREAGLDDISIITQIYNQGIEDRVATLDADLVSENEMRDYMIGRSEGYKVLVIADEQDKVYGWASINVFSSKCCYSGVADISIYIERSMRGKGLGKILLNYLIDVAKKQEFDKLVLSAFDFNEPGKRLYKSLGFREVGTYMNHGILDGKYVNVTIMEKLL